MALEDERNYDKTLMAWVQQVDEGQCDMQANPHLFSLPAVAFAPAKRIDFAGDHFHSYPASVYAKYDHSVASERPSIWSAWMSPR